MKPSVFSLKTSSVVKVVSFFKSKQQQKVCLFALEILARYVYVTLKSYNLNEINEVYLLLRMYHLCILK